MTLKVGDIIADYQVTGILGQGGMGTVYRVRSLISEREEALKVLTSDLGSPTESSARFQREIKIHASLDHPNIAVLRAAFWSGAHQLMMVMELVDGINLAERLRQGPVSIQDSLRWISGVLSALSYAHSAGVIHRDIKPANIIITPAGNAKLTDFGIAHSISGPDLTIAGVAVGSISYMSPEVIHAKEPDVRSDIYSAGVTLYELLTGAPPWAGSNQYEIMRARLESDVRLPDAINPEIQALLTSVVLRALAKQPDQRFQTAPEFLEALAPFLVSQSTRSTSSEATAFWDRSVLKDSSAPVTQVQSTPTPAWKREQTANFPTAARRVDPWDRAILETIARELGRYVGPIARVLVRRAAEKHSNIDDLAQTLAAEISSLTEREMFFKSLSRL
jgi:serine/threonine-protein kinase